MQSVHTLLKMTQLRWTGHVTRIPDERLPETILYGGRTYLENAPMVVRKSDTRTPSKPPLKTSTYQIRRNRSSKVARPHKKGDGKYEAKRNSEAEQKRAQQKTKAKAYPTVLSFSGLSCSICNRQFRAKIGLISHLRTHKQ